MGETVVLGLISKYTQYYQATENDLTVGVYLELVNVCLCCLAVRKLIHLMFCTSICSRHKSVCGNVLLSFLGYPIFDSIYVRALEAEINGHVEYLTAQQLYGILLTPPYNLRMWMYCLLHVWFICVFTRTNTFLVYVLTLMKNLAWFTFFYNVFHMDRTQKRNRPKKGNA